MMTVAVNEVPTLTVLYDGTCPLCRREIVVYRGLQASVPVSFADISDPSLTLPSGTTRRQLMERFHVRRGDGQLLSGAQAFLALWSVMPGWRWLAVVGRLPGAAWSMERLYTFFLRWRPALQRWALRLERRPKPDNDESRYCDSNQPRKKHCDSDQPQGYLDYADSSDLLEQSTRTANQHIDGIDFTQLK